MNTENKKSPSSKDKEYILSLSYGKDSLACLGAIEKLGWPLDRIVHAEIWATDTIQADLPPMVEFKEKADRIIKERYGIEVEHYCAMKDDQKLTYERMFYTIPTRRKPERERERENCGDNKARSSASRCGGCRGATAVSNGTPYGFPLTIGSWCKKLKYGTYLRIPDAPGKLVYIPQNISFPISALRGAQK